MPTKGDFECARNLYPHFRKGKVSLAVGHSAWPTKTLASHIICYDRESYYIGNETFTVSANIEPHGNHRVMAVVRKQSISMNTVERKEKKRRKQPQPRKASSGGLLPMDFVPIERNQ